MAHPCDTIGLLSSVWENQDVLRNVLSFVGNHSFRFVAPVNKVFYEMYSTLQSLTFDGDTPQVRRNTSTSYHQALQSISCAKILLEETSKKWVKYFEIATELGRCDVLWYIHVASGNRNLPGSLADIACAYGYLDCLKYAHEHGCH